MALRTMLDRAIELRAAAMAAPETAIISPGLTDPFSIDRNNPTPIYCMKLNPGVTSVVATVCRPNHAAIEEMAGKFKPLPEFKKIVTKDGNGETIEVSTDGNGEIVDVQKPMNFVPLAIAAAIAFAVLGG